MCSHPSPELSYLSTVRSCPHEALPPRPPSTLSPWTGPLQRPPAGGTGQHVPFCYWLIPLNTREGWLLPGASLAPRIALARISFPNTQRHRRGKAPRAHGQHSDPAAWLHPLLPHPQSSAPSIPEAPRPPPPTALQATQQNLRPRHRHGASPPPPPIFQLPSAPPPPAGRRTHLLGQEGDDLSTDTTEALHDLGLAGNNEEEACGGDPQVQGSKPRQSLGGGGAVTSRCKQRH